MLELADRKCQPCAPGTPALRGPALAALQAETPGWSIRQDHDLYREFRFPDFAVALAFVNRVGAVAEQEGHHPDLTLGWGRVGITIWTHSVGGLTESDFVLAAKIDRLMKTA